MNKSICEVDGDGIKWWYLNDALHREDGPAFEVDGGTKCWWLNGHRHREDGPAIECANGKLGWYLNDKAYFKKDYYKELVKRGIMAYEDAVLELI